MNGEEMSKVLDFLFVHRAPALPPDGLADIFDRLIWCLDDEGAALAAVMESWLQSEDKGRVEVALAMGETFPFVDAAEMTRVLTQVATRWPDLGLRCHERITERARQSVPAPQVRR